MICECPHGHRVETVEPFHLMFTEAAHEWEEGHETIRSGPICHICLVEWMEEQFPTKEVPPSPGD